MKKTVVAILIALTVMFTVIGCGMVTRNTPTFTNAATDLAGVEVRLAEHDVKIQNLDERLTVVETLTEPTVTITPTPTATPTLTPTSEPGVYVLEFYVTIGGSMQEANLYEVLAVTEGYLAGIVPKEVGTLTVIKANLRTP